MPTVPHLLRPTISIAYLQLLVEMLGERGIDRSRLLTGAEAPLERALEQADARMSAQQWTRLVMRACELSGEPGLGYEYGLRMRPTAHGVVGYATMTCTTLRQAVEISIRYARVRQAHFALHLEDQGDHALLVLREKFPIPVMRSFFCENILLGIVRGHGVLLGREIQSIDGLEIWFDWPEPDYHAAWRSRLPPVRFGMPCNALRITSACLNLKPALADPHASRHAIELCERELALAAGNEAAMSARVRALLTPGKQAGYLQLDEVADRLSTSSRSLKRRLHQEGTSFILILEETRRRDAHRMLLESDLPVQEIALRLGYINPANFTRAFSRWTGVSPSFYRAQQKAPRS